MEYLDIYDDNNKLTGKSVVRGTKDLPDGENIKLVVIWIENNGKYLIQKCSKEKGSVFAVTGGHVSTGNTATKQAVVELKEELGVQIEETSLEFLGILKKSHAIFEVYIIKEKITQQTKMSLQEEEVESVVWLDKKQIEELIARGVFRKTSQEHFEKFIK